MSLASGVTALASRVATEFNTLRSSLTASLAGKADDSTVVHLSGSESISGTKTFSSGPLVPTPGSPGNPVRNDDVRNSDARAPLSGSVTNSSVAGGAAIDEAKLALGSDADAGIASRRTLGTGATQAAAGNDARFTDSRAPTDGSVTDAKVSVSAAIAESKLALASDAAAGTASRRTLGTGATQATAGNDTRLSDARAPLPALGNVANGWAKLDGSAVLPQALMPAVAVTEFLGAVAAQAAMLALSGQRGDWCTRTDLGTDWQLIAEPSTTLASWRERTYPASPVSSVAGRTGAVTLSNTDVSGLGNSATRNVGATSGTVTDGADTRLSDTRTPTDGTVTDAKVASGAAIAESKLALASDAVAGTASRRTLGTGAQQATAGNDTRLSDSRTPTAGSVVDATVSASAAIAESKLSLASDAAAGTASRRTLGTGGTQAAAGNDSRITGAAPTADPTFTGTVTAARVVSTPVTVTWASTTTIDASLGNHFRITLAGGTTLALPSNLTDGQHIIVEVIQDATTARTLALGTNWNVTTAVTGAITISTTTGTRSYIGATYRSSGTKLDVLAFATGIA